MCIRCEEIDGEQRRLCVHCRDDRVRCLHPGKVRCLSCFCPAEERADHGNDWGLGFYKASALDASRGLQSSQDIAPANLRLYEVGAWLARPGQHFGQAASELPTNLSHHCTHGSCAGGPPCSADSVRRAALLRRPFFSLPFNRLPISLRLLLNLAGRFSPPQFGCAFFRICLCSFTRQGRQLACCEIKEQLVYWFLVPNQVYQEGIKPASFAALALRRLHSRSHIFVVPFQLRRGIVKAFFDFTERRPHFIWFM